MAESTFGIFAAYRVQPGASIDRAFTLVDSVCGAGIPVDPRAHVSVAVSKAIGSDADRARVQSTLDEEPELSARVINVASFNSAHEGYVTLVLELECPKLLSLHDRLLAQGLTHSFPKFSPHVTLSYWAQSHQLELLKHRLYWVLGRELVLDSPYVEKLKT